MRSKPTRCSSIAGAASGRLFCVQVRPVPFILFKEITMKLYVLPVLVFGLVIAASSSGGDAAKTDLKKLEGTWGMVSGEAKGEKLPESIVKNAKLTIVGDKRSEERRVGKEWRS